MRIARQVLAATSLADVAAIPSGGALVSAGGSNASTDAGEWEIDMTEVRIGKRIGIGSFGEVPPHPHGCGAPWDRHQQHPTPWLHARAPLVAAMRHCCSAQLPLARQRWGRLRRPALAAPHACCRAGVPRHLAAHGRRGQALPGAGPVPQADCGAGRPPAGGPDPATAGASQLLTPGLTPAGVPRGGGHHAEVGPALRFPPAACCRCALPWPQRERSLRGTALLAAAAGALTCIWGVCWACGAALQAVPTAPVAPQAEAQQHRPLHGRVERAGQPVHRHAIRASRLPVPLAAQVRRGRARPWQGPPCEPQRGRSHTAAVLCMDHTLTSPATVPGPSCDCALAGPPAEAGLQQAFCRTLPPAIGRLKARACSMPHRAPHSGLPSAGARSSWMRSGGCAWPWTWRGACTTCTAAGRPSCTGTSSRPTCWWTRTSPSRSAP